MKRLLTLLAAAALIVCLALTMTACNKNNKKPNSDNNNSTGNANNQSNPNQQTEIANPIENYNSLPEAESAIGYSFVQPGMLPEGYVPSRYAVIDKNTIEVNYAYNGKNIFYRAMRNSERDDISGNSNVFKQNNQMDYNSINYNTMGDDDRISVAYWRSGDMTYSLMFDEPVDRETFQSIVGSIGAENKS